MIDHTHDPAASSWVEGADTHADFPVQNLPLGVFSTAGTAPRTGIAIGDHVLDPSAVAPLLRGKGDAALAAIDGARTLNPLFALEPAARRELRHAVFALLTDKDHVAQCQAALIPAAQCTMHLPLAVRDYTDFYAGIHHARNVGSLLRPDNPLLPNYRYIPVGYHGRASSIRVSGGEVRRPSGQLRAPDSGVPAVGQSRRLDYEVEIGFWIGGQSELGDPVPIGRAASRIAGLCLLNDWSARDIQAWEYQPLGPFLAKNFGTTVSPWVITAEALAPFRVAQPHRPDGDPSPLPYLNDEGDQQAGALALRIDVSLRTRKMRDAGIEPVRLGRTEATNLYWTPAQLVAHHTVNGCDLAAGDLLGSGTISGAEDDAYGSLMEMSRGGTRSITLPGGETRTFLEDGDEVVLTGTANSNGFRSIGLGECRATIAPAR
ncbi:fumarylacetoacetase [Novosphingobium endophyticum]|uniref:fumarylacetoacetase n=1 Tax=Novosphingobium endophyticum TaxID=1955250 RepID=A0A916TT25_9SPHN|nr:fumarylacetoacetase [Novosphingobium endophyticum]GGC01309.1 fumarylacetoacetase [Novosphingobium endophyticum]